MCSGITRAYPGTCKTRYRGWAIGHHTRIKLFVIPSIYSRLYVPTRFIASHGFSNVLWKHRTKRSGRVVAGWGPRTIVRYLGWESCR